MTAATIPPAAGFFPDDRPKLRLVVLTTEERSRWQDQSKCIGNEDFLREPVAEQKVFCGGCPVAAECLSWALDHETKFLPPAATVAPTHPDNDWPVYGGFSVEERLEIIKRRRAAAK